jgi:hypothetical protein
MWKGIGLHAGADKNSLLSAGKDEGPVLGHSNFTSKALCPGPHRRSWQSPPYLAIFSSWNTTPFFVYLTHSKASSCQIKLDSPFPLRNGETFPPRGNCCPCFPKKNIAKMPFVSLFFPLPERSSSKPRSEAPSPLPRILVSPHFTESPCRRFFGSGWVWFRFGMEIAVLRRRFQKGDIIY